MCYLKGLCPEWRIFLLHFDYVALDRSAAVVHWRIPSEVYVIFAPIGDVWSAGLAWLVEWILC